VSSPAFVEEPRHRCSHAGGDGRLWWVLAFGSAPAGEALARRAGVGPGLWVGVSGFLAVSTCVVEHVGEDVPDLSGRLQDAGVVGPREYVPSSSEERVQGTRDADLEAGEAATESDLVVSFTDEVQVIGLHRVVDDAETEAGTARSDGALHDAEAGLRPQVGQPTRNAKGDVQRVTRLQLGTGDVWRARVGTTRAPRPLPPAAPSSGRREFERELFRRHSQ